MKNERTMLPIIPTANRWILNDLEEHEWKMKKYGGYKMRCRNCEYDCKNYNNRKLTIPHCQKYPNKKLIAQYEQGGTNEFSKE